MAPTISAITTLDGMPSVNNGMTEVCNFKLLVKGDWRNNSPSIDGIMFADERNESWQNNYVAMIEAARKHGWIDAQASAIRAHVERSN